MPRKLSARDWALTALLMAACYFPLFHQLGNAPVQIWDESLYAVNALEMEANRNYLIKYFYDKPDLWNTKPPFMIWVQILFMKAFGYNELAFRLPSALSAVLTLLLLVRFSWTEFRTVGPGLLAGLCLLTAGGYVTGHVTRTGDHDAPLVLLLTASALYAYKFLVHPEKKKRNALIASGALVLATLIKGIMGLLFLPGLFAFALLQRKASETFRLPNTYVAIGLYLIVVGGYYGYHEFATPGYLEAVWKNEMGGRYLGTIEGHRHDFWLYLNQLMYVQFTPWVFLFPVAAFVAWRTDACNGRAFAKLAVCVTVAYWLIISSAQTRMVWYNAPMLPLMSLVVGLGLHVALNAVMERWTFGPRERVAFVALVTICAFGLPYRNTVQRVLSREQLPGYLKFGYFVKHLAANKPNLQRYTILGSGWISHLKFYELASRRQPGTRIVAVNDTTRVSIGDTVMMCQDETKQKVKSVYDVRLLEQYDECELVVLKGLLITSTQDFTDQALPSR